MILILTVTGVMRSVLQSTLRSIFGTSEISTVGLAISMGHSVPRTHDAAPTLAELEAKGGYVPRKEFRDLNQFSHNEQQDEDAKREILFKFDLLRKSYPASSIPEYTVHTDLDQMEKSYNDCVRRLSLDSSVESYKTYLVYGFMGCEFVLGNFLGFDMQGFTQQQIISMHSYEKMLIELGEKSYVPAGSKWPVEFAASLHDHHECGFLCDIQDDDEKDWCQPHGYDQQYELSDSSSILRGGAQEAYEGSER